MAKGSSRSTADVDGRSGGCVGEYRRSGGRPLPGGTTGTEDPNLAVPGDLLDPPGTYGEPVAVKVARRVREAVRGNGPVERPEPRPGPTSQPKATASSTAAASTPSGSPCPRAGLRQNPASPGARRADQRLRTSSLKPLVTGHGRILEPDRCAPPRLGDPRPGSIRSSSLRPVHQNDDVTIYPS